MRYKKIMILTIILTCLLAVSAVSAAENVTDDIVSADVSDDVVSIEETTDQVVSVENDNLVVTEGNTSEVGSFADLQTEINNVGSDGVLNLTRDYKYVSGSTDGISINKPITIDGQGHAVDGIYLSKIFHVNGNNVNLMNIIFRGGNEDYLSYTAANPIVWKGVNGYLRNCTFENSSCYMIGSNGIVSNCNFYNKGINFHGDNCKLINSMVINCESSKSQGPIDWYGEWGILFNCTFENCSSSNRAGAIECSGDNFKMSACNFKNCYVNALGSSSGGYGGAISWSVSNGSILDCNFINCYVLYEKGTSGNGGAISGGGDNSIISRCLFVNCNVSSSKPSRVYDGGGAISCGGKNLNISDCIFENCVASIWGGAVSISSDGGKIFNCNFTKCCILSSSTQAQGGAIYVSGDDNTIFNCNFMECKVPYTQNSPYAGAIYWNGYDGELYNSTFLNCHASSASNNYGGAIAWGGLNGKLYDSKFINCHVTSSNYRGAILWFGEQGVISNTYFNPYYNSIYSEKDDLVITKLNSQIDCNNVSFTYMSNNDFKLYLKDYFGNNLGNRQITFENKDLNIKISSKTDSTGFATLPVEFTKTAGNYNVSALFNGDDNYNSIKKVFNLNIEPLDSNIIVNNWSGSVNQDIDLTVNVVCSNGVIIEEGTVTFFDGETNIGKSNVINGVATLEYVPTTSGKHTINAIYSSNNYNSSNSTFILTVSNANIDLNINVETVYFSNPSNFVINVNSNSREVNEGKIKFYVNNVFINTSDVNNGVASLNYVMDAAGSFNLSVVYDETDNYFGKNASKIFYVDKMPTTLSGETTFFDEEQSRIFTVNLKDNKGDGVNNQTVKIEVVKYSGESKTLTNVTDENGVAFFDVGSLAGGMWIVRGIFDENNNYQGSLFTDKFIVIRMNTTTTIDEIKDSHKGYPIQLHANILDEFGVWITDGIAHFYVDGKDCGYIDYSSKRIFPYRSENKQILRASIPDFDNQLGATVADSSNLYLEYLPTEGTHTINVVYEGTSLYRPSNHTTTFEVQDGAVPTTLVATNINAIYNGGGYLVATLKDVWGKPIPNVKISINVKGVKYLTTDKNGQVKFSTNGLAPKSYIATITFAGNNNYVKSSATAKVTVKKSTPKLSATKKTFKKSVKIKKYAVTLKDNQNKVMKNTKVTIKVNKKTYTAKTNAKGKAVFKIKNLAKKGKYNAVVTYKGNKYYNKVTKKTKIIVK